MLQAVIKEVAYHLPEGVLTNADLSAAYPEWSVEKITDKTGISERHVTAEGEFASDLGVAAAKALFAKGTVGPEDVDFLLFCTQSPDYLLPTTACLVQDRLGLPTSCGALDFNLGCSGYVYGLSLAKGIIETGQAKNVLLITSDTYSRLIHPGDKSVRTLFGDGATATLLQGEEREEASIGPFVFGTDGSGVKHLLVPNGGARSPRIGPDAPVTTDESGNTRTEDNLYMNGAEVFTFTLRAVPPSIQQLLERAGLAQEDVDLFVFHQANQFMLEHLRKKMKIPAEKCFLAMKHCGNTVSSTIPIALVHALAEGKIAPGSRVMLVGFGVGYSWAATMVRWA